MTVTKANKLEAIQALILKSKANKAIHDAQIAQLLKSQVREHKVEEHFRTKKKLVGLGLSPPTYPIPSNYYLLIEALTSNHLAHLAHTTQYTLAGWLSFSSRLIESGFVRVKQDRRQVLSLSNAGIRSELKWLKRGRKQLSNFLNPVPTDRVVRLNPVPMEIFVSFIDRSIALSSLIEAIILLIGEVIGEGYRYKAIGIYELGSGLDSSPFQEMIESFVGSCGNKGKIPNEFTRVGFKIQKRRERLLEKGIVLDRMRGKFIKYKRVVIRDKDDIE